MMQKKRNTQRGQSILEFAVFIPLFFMLMFYLIQMSMAVNGGIVNEQYARARLFEMLAKHRDYPLLRFTQSGQTRAQEGWQRFWIGMDRESWFTAEDRDPGDRNPIAPEVPVGPQRGPGSSPDDETFPNVTHRSKVRVRTIAFICMPPKFLPGQTVQDASQRNLFLSEIIGTRALSNVFRGGSDSPFGFCDRDAAAR